MPLGHALLRLFNLPRFVWLKARDFVLDGFGLQVADEEVQQTLALRLRTRGVVVPLPVKRVHPTAMFGGSLGVRSLSGGLHVVVVVHWGSGNLQKGEWR